MIDHVEGYPHSILLEEDLRRLSVEQLEFLDIIKNNADHLLMLINDLLDLSRIEAGAVDLQLAPLDLARLLQQVVTSLRPQVEAKAQQLIVDLPAVLPAMQGDADRVIQILTNLLSNAHKYTLPGGSITVATRLEHNQVRVDVSDTGVGVSPGDQEKIFTRFFRSCNRSTQDVPGAGLGLAITRSLVEMQGGEINVTSTLGKGSTFTFTLPVMPIAAHPAQERKDQPA